MSDPAPAPRSPRKPRRTPLDLDPKQLAGLTQRLKLLSDESRVRMLSALSHGDLHVGGLCEVVGMGPAAVSHHLSLLRVAGVIHGTRDGKYVRYELTDLGWSAVAAIAEIAD